MADKKNLDGLPYNIVYQLVVDRIKSENANERVVDTEMFQKYRRVLSGRFYELLEEKGTGNVYPATVIGTPSVSIISRSRLKEFRLNMQHTTNICYKVFGMSVHEFLSGERPRIMLPQSLNIVARCLLAEQTSTYAKTLAKEIKHLTAASKSSPMTTDFLLPQRFVEAAIDKATEYDKTFMSTLPRQRIVRLSNMIDDPAKAAEKPISLRVALTYAVLMDMPIDYLVAQNYVPFADIFCTTMVRKPEKLTDPNVLAVIEALLEAPDDIKTIAIAEIIHRKWSPLMLFS